MLKLDKIVFHFLAASYKINIAWVCLFETCKRMTTIPKVIKLYL
jgi:hypothetical protein